MSSMEAPSFCACLTEEFMNTVQREPRSTGWVEARAFCVNSSNRQAHGHGEGLQERTTAGRAGLVDGD